MLDQSEFDQYADTYQAQHAASIWMSGEAPDFFSKWKVNEASKAVREAGAVPQRILDFGAGVGNSLKPMRLAFPMSDIVLLDPSLESLKTAERRFPMQAHFCHFDGVKIPFDDGHFDLVFVACVFHHITQAQQEMLLKEIFRCVSSGGHLFLVEHNPLNPLTRYAVRTCPFDENAVLISASQMRKRVTAAGFPPPRVEYRIFFPRILAMLRPLECRLGRFAIGAQYFVHAIKPGC